MDKLIKSIPKAHMGTIIAKADAVGISSSAYIRGLIQRDVGVMDIVIKDLPYDANQRVKRNAAASGLTVEEYILSVLVK